MEKNIRNFRYGDHKRERYESGYNRNYHRDHRDRDNRDHRDRERPRIDKFDKRR